mgnify:CR=1 FL=1
MQCIYCIIKQGLVPRALNKKGTHLKGTFSMRKQRRHVALAQPLNVAWTETALFDIHPTIISSTIITFSHRLLLFQIETADRRFSKSPP